MPLPERWPRATVGIHLLRVFHRCAWQAWTWAAWLRTLSDDPIDQRLSELPLGDLHVRWRSLHQHRRRKAKGQRRL